jgi:ArsR family transcriptional regulator, zinc-responsive transcriptional repressor
MARNKKSNSTAPLPLNPQALKDAAECLKTLAHPVRLRIVQLLLRGRYTVGELAVECDVPQNVASEHLRLMQRCGFFISQREGRRVFYQVAEPHLEQLMACIEGRFFHPAA